MCDSMLDSFRARPAFVILGQVYRSNQYRKLSSKTVFERFRLRVHVFWSSLHSSHEIAFSENRAHELTWYE